MNRDRFTYYLTTKLANTAVSFNSSESSLAPIASTISLWATYPRWRFFSYEYARLFKAFTGAKPRCSILTYQPWLNIKNFTAVLTNKWFSINPFGIIRPAYLLTSESVCWALAFAVLIANQMLMWHFPMCHMPFATTRIATKSCSFVSIGLN